MALLSLIWFSLIAVVILAASSSSCAFVRSFVRLSVESSSTRVGELFGSSDTVGPDSEAADTESESFVRILRNERKETWI